MEEWLLELLEKLVLRYNALCDRISNENDGPYREALEIRASEVIAIIYELFGEDSVDITSTRVSRMFVRRD